MLIDLSPVTLGTSALGRGTAPGSPEEADAVAGATALFDSGHALIDTSNNYADGRSEQVLGLAIAQRGGDSARRVVTKVDRDPATGAFDRDRVLRSHEESLARLGIDRVGLLHLHDPYTVSFDVADGPGGAIEAMVELRDSGAVDAIGIAAGPVPMVRRYVDTDVFDAVLVHNRYTLVDRSAEPLFANARRRGMLVFNAAPFGSGLLAAGATDGAMYHYQPAAGDLLEWTRRAERVCAEAGVSLTAAALHFSLRGPFIDSTIVGVTNARRVAELDALLATEIPVELWHELEDLGPAPSPIDDSEFE
ncbi:aldo/keto reductase [Microbacterium thalassium]|uniref:D-threo-aldose 1-dehydrogenase n=1 Tax=Microbacterium thalassium TaxID=362649 RepID=A0A7X0FSP5_9MICO|nr:aldo/keto reductase [Microbacterium thalassium]MBB6393013.1 D-threo-aldose 1-dehydrogenase [Microbacterium thalassium]GLK22756.1 oxidoreductase [Microbacterium thalassium]